MSYLETDDEPTAAPAKVYAYIVAIYLVDKSCGGPEEGGWYYEHGEYSLEHAGCLQMFLTEREAIEYRDGVQRDLDEGDNKGRPSIDSVLSEGQYRAIIWQNFAPHHFPTEVPHYE